MNRKIIFLAALVLAISACAPQQPTPVKPTPTAITLLAPESFSDPFAYCDAIGNADKSDIRYTGKALPDAVLQGFLKAIDASPEARADENFTKMTRWRCMNHQVYACNFGANLPCDSPADTNKEPNQGEKQWCTENPNSDMIPMVYSGHATIYNWRCENGTAVPGEMILHADERGFIKEIWYLISPQQ